MHPTQQYLQTTAQLLGAHKVWSYSTEWDWEPVPFDTELAARVDALFGERDWSRAGERMSYSQHMIHGVFPQSYYEQAGEDLARLLGDPRVAVVPAPGKRSTHSFFGSLARPRNGWELGYVQFALARLRNPVTRGMPQLQFEVEPMDWVLRPLATHLQVPRTYRTTFACLSQMALRWDNPAGRLRMFLVMRSTQWSHWYGDIWGGHLMMGALLKELGWERGTIHIYSPSITMDAPGKARALLAALPC